MDQTRPLSEFTVVSIPPRGINKQEERSLYCCETRLPPYCPKYQDSSSHCLFHPGALMSMHETTWQEVTLPAILYSKRLGQRSDKLYVLRHHDRRVSRRKRARRILTARHLSLLTSALPRTVAALRSKCCRGDATVATGLRCQAGFDSTVTDRCARRARRPGPSSLPLEA